MPGDNANLPVTWSYWIAAAAPILVLFVLLVWRKWSSTAAAAGGLVVGVAVALLLFETPLHTLAVAAGMGIWDALFVLYLIWPALLIFSVGDEAGAFRAIRKGMERYVPSRLLAIFAFGWVFPSFIQGVSGGAAPMAVAAPLLVGLGVKPFYAVFIPLLSRTWGNMLGSLGESWFATLAATDVGDEVLTLRLMSILLWIPNLTGGLAVAWLYGHGHAIRRAWPAIALISLIHGGGELLLSPIMPALGAFIATAVAMGAIPLLARWDRYSKEVEPGPSPIFTEEAREQLERKADRQEEGGGGETARREDEQGANGGDERPARMSLWVALSPYAVLTGLAVLVLVVPGVKDFAARWEIGLPFPETGTGLGVTNPAEEAYNAFAPLTHPGTVLFLAAAFGYLLYRARGYYRGAEGAGPLRVLRAAAVEALPATTVLATLTILAKVMELSGQLVVLALGIAMVAPTLIFLGVSNFLGVLGAFVTSSNTTSNILLAPLQVATAEAQGLPPELLVAAQSAGASTGNAIAPADILGGLAAVGIVEQLGRTLAKALPWTLANAALIAAATIVLYWLWF